MLTKCVLVLSLAAVVLGRVTQGEQNAIPEDAPRSESSSYLGDVRFLYKTYQECSTMDLSPCLKLKLVAALDRAARAYGDVSLFEGVTFVKDPLSKPEDGPAKTEAELEATLPRALEDKEDTLNGLIMDKIFSFFQSHTLQVKLPSAEDIQRSIGEERGKKKRMGALLLIPLLIGGTMIPLAFGALALLAGKALIVSKLALVLAAIIGLKKLISSSHGGGESGHEVVVAGGHSGGWGRNYDAQNLAYSAFAPKA